MSIHEIPPDDELYEDDEMPTFSAIPLLENMYVMLNRIRQHANQTGCFEEDPVLMEDLDIICEEMEHVVVESEDADNDLIAKGVVVDSLLGTEVYIPEDFLTVIDSTPTEISAVAIIRLMRP